MIRLIAVDLDDTLLGEDLKISRENKDAIRTAQQQGVHIVIVTARGWFSTQFFYKDLGLDGYSVCGSGTKIYDHLGRCCKAWYIPLERAKEILTFAHQEEIMVLCSVTDRNLFTLVPEEWRPKIRPTIDFQIENLHLHLEESPTQLFLKGKRDVEKMLEWLPCEDPHFRVHTVMYRDQIPEMMILHPESNKATGLAWVCKQLGIHQDEVLALGDSANDISMLKWAGIGVAMGWAPSPVKEAANYVTEEDDLNGVATAIHKFVLEK